MGLNFRSMDLELCALIKIYQFVIISDDFHWKVKTESFPYWKLMVFVKKDKIDSMKPWEISIEGFEIFTFLHLFQKDIFVHSLNETGGSNTSTNPQSFVWLSRQGHMIALYDSFLKVLSPLVKCIWNQHAIVILLAMTGTKGRLTDSHTDCKLIWLGIPLSFLY